MDSIVEKFGIYDVMGIWGAGALTITYFLFTSRKYLIMFLSIFGIANPIQSELYLFIILYTAVSYFIGVILQELGKIMIDRVSIFDLTKADNFLCENENGKGIFKKVFNAFAGEVRKIIPVDRREGIEFYSAHSYLKYSGNTKRSDKSHSAYALSRSLTISFLAHCLLQVLFLFLFSAPIISSLLLIAIDLFFMMLFLERSYRYFNSWIRDVFIQYYEAKKDVNSTP